MPRKKGSSNSKKSIIKNEKKNTYKDIDIEDIRAKVIGNMFQGSEGKLTKFAIENRFSRTYRYQLINKGWIEEKNGFFIPTKTFKNEFAEVAGKEKIIYGGSGSSEQHVSAISNLVSFIPSDALIRGDYKSGQTLIEENHRYKKTKQYKEDVRAIKDDISNQRREAEEKYQTIIKDPSISRADKIYAQKEYKDAIKMANLREEVINSKRNISPPDLWVRLTRDEAIEYVNSIRENIDDIVEERYRDRWLERLDRMEERAITSTETLIEYSLEVVTDSYRLRDIVAKQNHATVNNAVLDFLRV
jgi:hypothetical protein